MYIYKPFIFCILCLFFLPAGYTQQFSAPLPKPFMQRDGMEFFRDQLILKVKPAYRSLCQEEDIDIPALRQVLGLQRQTSVHKHLPFLNDAVWKSDANDHALDLIYRVSLSPGQDVLVLSEMLEGLPEIAYAEPRYIYRTFYLPNDPLADTSWLFNRQWHLPQIRALEAWDIEQGEDSVVVGISDSGISYSHPDLRNNLAYNQADPIDGIDNDGDGFVDNYRGWDLAGVDGRGFGDNDASFVDEHGVNVSGIACAQTDNGVGVASVGFRCRYLPLKTSPDLFPGFITHGFESILYAVEHGAHIVNCSWGSRTRTKFGEDIINYATETKSAAIIAACGNTRADIAFFPAAYENVISVTNSYFDDSLCCAPKLGYEATYNYSVDISAPGYLIYTVKGATGYGNFFGTSASSPVVAGAVAITLSHFPHYTGFQAAQRVRVTTDEIYDANPYNEPYRDKMGTGRVNMFKALTDPLKPSIRKLSYSLTNLQGSEVLAAGDTVKLSGEFINYLDPSTTGLGLSLEIPNPDQRMHLEMLDDAHTPGIVETNEIFANPDQPFLFVVKPTAPENLNIDLKLVYRDTALSYLDFEYLEFRVNPTMIDVTENLLLTSLNSVGNIGYDDYPDNETGLGYQYNGNTKGGIREAGFILGTSGTAVADNIRNANNIPSGGFTRNRIIERVFNSDIADFEAEGEFEAPALGIRIKQNAYAWSYEDLEDFVILEYTLYNDNPTQVDNLFAGLYFDWDITLGLLNACNFDFADKFIYGFDIQPFDGNLYGVAVVSNDNFRAYARELPNFGYTDAEKYTALTNIPTANTAAAGITSNGADVIQFISTGPITLASNGEKRIAFALVGARDLGSMRILTQRARETYRCYVLEEGPTSGFSVSSNPAGVNQLLQFTDLNTLSALWQWDFGDGTTSTQRNPQHSFAQAGLYRVTMSTSNGVCTVLKSKDMRISPNATSIDELSPLEVLVYPNPGAGTYFLEWGALQAQQAEIWVHDAMGRQVYSQTTSVKAGDTYTLDLTGNSTGLYFLTLRMEEGTRSFKLFLE